MTLVHHGPRRNATNIVHRFVGGCNNNRFVEEVNWRWWCEGDILILVMTI